jgi:hypothetical protein
MYSVPTSCRKAGMMNPVLPEAPNNRFWPAAVMTASKHLAVPIGGVFARAREDSGYSP